MPWIHDREPTDNPAYSRILDDNHMMAMMPVIGRQLASGQGTATVVQVSNLLVEDHVLNGQAAVATLLLEPINAILLRAPVTVSLNFPLGVDYVVGSMSQPSTASTHISYNPATRQLSVANIHLNPGGPTAYTYRLTVNAPTTPVNLEIHIQTTASAHYEYRVRPSVLRVGQSMPPQTITPSGGVYMLGQGRVTLTFPPNAVARSTTITGVEYADSPIEPGQIGHAVLFEVFPAMTFKYPVTAQIDLRGLVITESLAPGQWPRLDHVHTQPITRVATVGIATEIAQLRDEVPATFDAAAGMLTAQLTHFSTYEAGVNHTAPVPWKFETNLGSVNAFRGAATVGYAFNVPKMQDGLQPALSVQYSSAAADQGTTNSAGPGSDGPGLGWSFDNPQVTRRVKAETEEYTTYSDPSGCGAACRQWHHFTRFVGSYVNDFSLSLGGSQYWLVPGDVPGEYVAENYALLRIRRCNDETPCLGADSVAGVVNDAGEFWQVWTPDGTRYVFGVTPDSEQLFPVSTNAPEGTSNYAGRIPNKVASAWQLSAVYARHRDDPAMGRASAIYRYHDIENELHIERAALAEVWYGSSLTPQGAIMSGPTAWHVIVDYTMRGNKQLQPVYVRVIASKGAGTSDELLRRYTLEYNARFDLSSVRQEVWNGAAYVSLPELTFGYTQPSDRWMLSEVANGYGGSQHFTYERIGPISYRVTQLDIQNGLGWASQTRYRYGEPCYNRAGSACRTAQHEWSPSAALVGHDHVTQVLHDPVSRAILATSAESFYVDYQKLGRAYEQIALDTAGTKTLARQTTDYQVLTGVQWGLPTGSWFLTPYTVTAYPSGLNGVVSHVYKRIETTYSPPTAGNRFVAQPTQVREYSGATLTKRSETQFQLSPRFMLQPVHEQIFDAANRPLSDMRYIWDGRTGDLTFVQQAVVLEPCPPEIDQSRASCDVTRDIAVGYDVLGNKTSETVFDDYGTPGMVRTAGRTGATSRFEYDTGYGLFPVTWINALSQMTRVEYYGLNGVDLPSANGARLRANLGQVKREIGPNGEPTAVSYTYDVFGRLLSMTQPEPAGNIANITTSLPTMEYAYSDGTVLSGTYAVSDITGNTYPSAQILQTGLPLKGVVITTRQRPNSQQTVTIDTAQIVDGLGRSLQTKAPTDIPGRWNAVYMGYDAAGRAVRQSVSVPSARPLASLDYPSAVNWSSLPHSLSSFDDLGRPVAVTGPDGTSTRSAYDAYNVAVLDANGHLRVNINDALGRLIQVQEYSGTFSTPTFAATPYATTRYAYDPADRLIQVDDALGHHTVITYNAFGEKTAMQDPDMGVWNYAYNARGQLMSQTDAKGQTLTFAYDVGGRLLSKGQQDGVMTQPLAQFGYDSGPFGTGQRTMVSDATGTWQASYDTRGRVITETRTITLTELNQNARRDFGSYILSHGYDNLNRATWLQYPDDEVVTTTHGTQGPAQLVGQTALVTAATYNSQGQPTQLTLGNGLSTRYGYYGYAAFRSLLSNGSGLPVTDVGVANFGRLARVCTTDNIQGIEANSCNVPTTNSAQLPQSLHYEYDRIGNVTQITDLANAGQVQQFDYDPLDRLVSASTDGLGIGQFQQRWSYDAIGNMTAHGTLTSINNAWLNDQYANAADKPHAVIAVTRDAATSFAAGYDLNGNMITRTEAGVMYVQAWDIENRLISVTIVAAAPLALNVTPTQEQYFYSADGERIAKHTTAGTTIYIGELYEETWPNTPTASSGLSTASMLNGELVPSVPKYAGRSRMGTLAVAASSEPLPAGEPADLRYAVDFGQGGPVPDWDVQDGLVYDCEVEHLKLAARDPASQWLTHTWTSAGWRVEGQNVDHVVSLFNTTAIFSDTGPLIVTGEALWGDEPYLTGLGTAVRLVAFRPRDFVTPSIVTTGTLLAGATISVPREQASARWLYWDAGTPSLPACQSWRERYGVNPNSQIYVTDTAGYPGPVMQSGVAPAWSAPYYFKAIYMPETQINTPEERGRIELYASLSDSPVNYALMRVETNKLRPHSVLVGNAALVAGSGNWVTLVVKRLAVYAPTPVMDPLPIWSEGNLRSLSWTYSGLDTAQAFEVQRATDAEFSVGVTTQTVIAPITGTTFTGLHDGTTYFYRTRAWTGPITGTEPSPWSAVVSSTQDVNAPVISNLVPSASPLYLSPNGDAVLDRMTFSFDTADAAIGIASWQASVWTAGGALVRTFPAQTSAPFTFAWDGRMDDSSLAADGPYEARVIVTDALGHAAYGSFASQIRLDTVSPAEQVTSLYQPNKGLAINWAASDVPTLGQGFAVVHGKTNLMDVNGVTQVTLDGHPILLAGQDFTATVTPAIGPNILNFGFTDPAGNILTLTRTLIYTTTGPSLITFGPTGTVVAHTVGLRPTISGTFDPLIPVDSFSVHVTIDGIPTTGTITAAGFAVQPVADVLGGNGRLARVVADFTSMDGRTGQAEWLFGVDTRADLAVTLPISGSALNQAAQFVIGQTDPNAQVVLRVSGTEVTRGIADAMGHFEFAGVMLPVGTFTLDAEATDPYGHVATQPVMLMLDPSAASAALDVQPSAFSPNGDGVREVVSIAAVVQPPANGVIEGWRIEIAPALGGVPVRTWQGQVVVTPTLTWDGSGAPDGQYWATLWVTSTTSALTNPVTRTAQVRQLITLDRSVPAAPVIIAPTGVLTTALPPATGTATPGSGVLVYRDGLTVTTEVAWADSNGLWVLTRMPLRAGENTLTARAQNLAGSWSGWSAPVIVTVPVQPPLISVGVAPDIAGLGANLILTATARGDNDPAPAVMVIARPRERSTQASLSKAVSGGLIGSWQVNKLADTDWCAPLGFCLDELIFAGTDTLGNTGLATTTLTLDYLPPDAPQIDSPRARAWIQTEGTWLRGHVLEPLLTVVLTGGVSPVTVTAQTDGRWEAWVPLTEGVNVLNGTAYDGLGNASTTTPYSQITLHRDTLPPTVTAGGVIYTRQGTAVVLSATVNDAGLVNLAWADTDHTQIGTRVPLGAWNADEATIGQARLWQRAVGQLSTDGVFSMTYRAADAAGYTGMSAPQVLIVDSVRPALTVTNLSVTVPYGWSVLTPSPKVWYGLGSGSFAVNLSLSDNLAGLGMLSWPEMTSAGGSVVYGGAVGAAPQWNYTFSETSTFNQPALFAVTDRSGNRQLAGVQVLRDVTPPTILSLDAPTKVSDTPVVVRWNAVDDGAGLRGYDLSVLVDGLTRTHVLTQSTATTYVAGILPAGHIYEWQLVAWDNVNNSRTRMAMITGMNWTKTYYFGSSPVAVRENGVLTYLHSDHLSSVSAATDANGKVVGRQLFEPYGAVRATFGEVDGSWGWATHRKSEATGLTFMRARWYAAGVGRFVSPDSVVPSAADPQAFNRYSYSRNSPLSQIDPTGHWNCWILQAICDLFDPPTPKITVNIYPQPTPTPTSMPPTSTPQPTPTSAPSPTAIPQPINPTPQSASDVNNLMSGFNPFSLMLPVNDIEYNNGFGDFLNDGATVTPHDGYDVRSASGDTSVMAMASGEVLWVDSNSASVGILSESGLEIQYTHLDTAYNKQLTKGQKVQQGEKIGNYGLYGDTNYAHVHITFRIGPNRTKVDPGEYWPGGRPDSWTFGTLSQQPTITPQPNQQ